MTTFTKKLQGRWDWHNRELIVPVFRWKTYFWNSLSLEESQNCHKTETIYKEWIALSRPNWSLPGQNNDLIEVSCWKLMWKGNFGWTTVVTRETKLAQTDHNQLSTFRWFLLTLDNPFCWQMTKMAFLQNQGQKSGAKISMKLAHIFYRFGSLCLAHMKLYIFIYNIAY